jgi:Xaa-Pro aminopeptidase
MSDRRDRARAVAAEAGADVLLVSDPSAVAWLTGYAADIETGPSPFALSPLAVLLPEGVPVLVLSEDEAEAGAETGCDVVSYPGFGLGPLDPVAGAARALAPVLRDRSVATDAGFLSAALARDLEWIDVGAELARSRALKDADELERIRAAIAVCDAGQQAARSHAAPGVTELELWAAIRGAMEDEAGCRLPVLADLVSGPRTTEVGGPPGTRRLQEGDVVLCDLVPRLAGYWGDSCATFAVGEPDASAVEAHARVRETLDSVVASIRPGATAADLDADARARLTYPHHTGHGLGTSYHEEPRIVPAATTVLEAGMVVAVEPGSYGGTGVRLEQVVVVTPDGCEVLSGHDLRL